MNRNAREAQLVRTASEWLVRLRQSAPDPEEIAEWLAWYEADDRHKQAYDDIQAFWAQAGAMPEPDRLVEDAETAPQARRTLRDLARGLRVRLAPRAVPGRFALAGATALALVAGFLLWTDAFVGEAPDQPVVTVEGPRAYERATDVAARSAGTTEHAAPERAATERAAPVLMKEAYLSDGSQVALAEKSVVSVRFTRKQRLLVMDRDGVAYFSVAHNRKRPFIVKAGAFYIRAVGTRFNVRSTGGRVVVTVTEGAVDIYREDDSADGDVPSDGVVRAGAGREVVWMVTSKVPTIAAVDVSHALAWQKGVLEYLNEPLGSAIHDINRYSSRAVVIGDPAVAQILFSGTILTDSTDAWIKALPTLFPVEVVTNDRGDLVLVRRGDAARPSN